MISDVFYWFLVFGSLILLKRPANLMFTAETVRNLIALQYNVTFDKMSSTGL